MIKQIHLDLETLDTAETAQLLSIGGVCDDYTFYREIDTGLYRDYPGKFTTSESTVKWWQDRGGFQPSQDLLSPVQALRDLSCWLGLIPSYFPADVTFEIWANSPSFDCSMIKHHFKMFDMPQSWNYYAERDVRTIKALALDVLKLPLHLPEKPHHALQDAIVQRDLVAVVYNHLIRLQQACLIADYTIEVEETPVPYELVDPHGQG